MNNIYLLLALFFILGGCSNAEKPVTKEMMMIKVLKSDPTAQLVVPKDITAGVHCKDYGPGCKHGHLAKILGLDMIFIEFENKMTAKNEAIRINGYYVDNWVFDDVRGEPILEKFIKEKLGVFDPSTSADKKEQKK